jgi:[acyl-carrier-protein] S-malonyltransferase
MAAAAAPGVRTAFVFPGQGSQRIGMLADAARRWPQVEETFAEASDALGYDAWDLVHNGTAESLNLTETTQPVLLTASVALWRCWLAAGGERPLAMAGHSLGELSALVCAGALDFSDAVRLVRLRGRYMQNAVPVGEGAMSAILGLADEQVQAACAEAAEGQVVEAVNYNAPGQVVIAGHDAAVGRAETSARARGARRTMRLAVSAPFHTSLMREAGDRLARDIDGVTLTSPQIPVLHNVHARPESDPRRIASLLVEQVSSPVQWVASVHQLAALGAERLVECGPGKVLVGLARRIERRLEGHTLEIPDDFDHALQAVGGH